MHPKVDVELDLSDGCVDLIENGYGLARFGWVSFPELEPQGQAPRQISRPRRVRSSPEDTRQTRPPAGTGGTHPARMRLHPHHGTRQQRLAIRCWWPAQDHGKSQDNSVQVGAQAVNEAAAQGLGIANSPLWQVRSLVDRGAVELVLTRFEPPPMPVHAVWPTTNSYRPRPSYSSSTSPRASRPSASKEQLPQRVAATVHA